MKNINIIENDNFFVNLFSGIINLVLFFALYLSIGHVMTVLLGVPVAISIWSIEGMAFRLLRNSFITIILFIGNLIVEDKILYRYESIWAMTFGVALIINAVALIALAIFAF